MPSWGSHLGARTASSREWFPVIENRVTTINTLEISGMAEIID